MGSGWRDIMLQVSAVSPVSGCPGAATHPGHCCWYFHSRDPGVTCSLLLWGRNQSGVHMMGMIAFCGLGFPS